MDFTKYPDNAAAMKAAEDDLQLPSGFFDRMWETESGRGTNMLSPKKARGHFQVMPREHGVMSARAGRALDPDNFADSLWMAHGMMKENLGRFKTVEKATAAYNGGWSEKNWNNPETQGYLTKVLGNAPQVMPKSAPTRGLPVTDIADLQQRTEENTALRNEATLGAVLKRKFYDDRENALWNFAERKTSGLGDDDKEYSWLAQPERYDFEESLTPSEVSYMRENATSADRASWAKMKIEEHRENDKFYGASGTATNLATSLGVGLVDPVGFMAGVGVGKAFQMGRIGSRILAAEGRMGAAGASLLAEGAIGNVAWEMAQDATGQVKTLEDYGLATMFGAAFSTIAAPSVLRDAYTSKVDMGLQDAGVDMVDKNIDRATTDGRPRAERAPAQVADINAYVNENRVVRNADELGEDVAVPRDLMEAQRAADEAPATPEVPLYRGSRNDAKPDENGVLFTTPSRAVAEGYAGADGQVANVTRPAGKVFDLSAEGPQISSERAAALLADQGLTQEQIDTALFDVPLDGAGNTDTYRLTRSAAYVNALRDAGIERTVFVQTGADGKPAATHALLGADPRANRIVADARNDMGSPVTESLGEETTVRDILRDLANAPGTQGGNSRDAVFANRMVQRLADILPEATMLAKFKFNKATGKQVDPFGNVVAAGPLERGAYNPGSDTGVLPGLDAASVPGMDARGRNPALIAVHEIVHAATGRMILAVQRNLKGVPQEAKQAVARLDELRQELIAHLTAKGEYKPDATSGANYATKNVDEFASQMQSDRDTINTLASMDGKGFAGDSALDRGWRAILGLLGMKRVPPGQRTMNAAEEAGQLVEIIMRVGRDLPEGVNWDYEASMRMGEMANYGPELQGPGNLTATQDAAFAARMTEHANSWLTRNPINPERLKVLAQSTTKKGSTIRDTLVSDGLKMASSANPILRMMSGLVVEVTTGAAGRRNTAALRKDMIVQSLTGRGVIDYHSAYGEHRRLKGGRYVDDFLNGDLKRAFDKEVYVEILNRRYNNPSSATAAVRAGADALEGMHSRSLAAQKAASTLGSAHLPADSVGYVSQALQGDALAGASNKDLVELSQHLTNHWMHSEGWNRPFAQEFSRVYIARAKRRANGENGVDFVATESPSAAVRDTLEEMQLTSRSLDARARAELDRVGAQPQNKARLDVDLLATLPSGKRVLDFYSTDVERLTRTHVNRVSGAVALAEFNVLGNRGINNILRSVDLADADQRAMPEERAALVRSFAQILGTPVPGEVRSQAATNIAGVVRAQSLGGLAFTQLSEMANITHHLGFASVIRGLSSLPAMVREVQALKNGKAVSNDWLGSIEEAQGFNIGMEGFTLHAALDPPDELLRNYGKGPDVATRAIAAGNHLQAKLSFFRGLHAAQHRSVAELILKKTIGYAQDGNGGKYLEDMGISPALARAIKQDLPRALIKDANGNPVGFDITQLSTAKAQSELLGAIHRGTSQIIQKTFIGETGAWASNDVLKMLFQLRTFGLTAMEKQWGRTRTMNSGGMLNGYGYATGVLLGQMAMAIPIYLARVQLSALGRDDAEDFVEKATAPASMLATVMNYTAVSGLTGDAFDAMAGLGGGWSDDVKGALGARNFGGGVASVVPAAGRIDQAWRVASGGGSVYSALKQLPMSNLPFIVPIINLTKED